MKNQKILRILKIQIIIMAPKRIYQIIWEPRGVLNPIYN
jgi:hypothetical protein